MEKFDLIVLGGGPAGYNAAERAAEGGLKTVVIEKRALGGVCLNEGCIPSKTLIHSGKLYEHALDSAVYGVTAENVKIDQKKVIARKNKVVSTLVGGIGMAMKKHGVKVVNAFGTILGKTEEGFEVEANGEKYVGTYMLLCAGSEAVVPPIPGLREGVENGFVLTNREILDLEEIPERLVVIGGGVIGMEMASYYSMIGSKVTVVEMLDHIGGPTDIEIAKILQKNYAKAGVEFKLGCKVTSVGEGKVCFEENGEAKSVEADKVLCAIGRRAVTQGYGLENLNVYMERGAVVTDDQMRTNVPGLFAAGDINGKVMLAHTAYREGEVAINTILGKKDHMRYNAIPSVIYTCPEVGSVGLTEEQARAAGYDVEVAKVSMMFSGRYLAENEGGDGICKLVVDKKYNRLLGVHLIGSYASEIIYGAAIMVETEMQIQNIKEIVFPHPTVCEVIREALYDIK